jgi:hypothetical protein
MEVNKSIHFRLDGQGDVVVAAPVYEALLKVPGMGGLTADNPVENPPDIYVGAVAMPTQNIVNKPLNRDQTPDPFYVPGRTQYESRDLMKPKITVPQFIFGRPRKPSQRKV